MRKGKRSPAVLVLLLIAGAVIGSALWSMLAPILPEALAKNFSIGSTSGPWSVDLVFISLTLGIVLSLNIGSLIGIIVAIVVFYSL